eukprot:g440.t1
MASTPESTAKRFKPAPRDLNSVVVRHVFGANAKIAGTGFDGLVLDLLLSANADSAPRLEVLIGWFRAAVDLGKSGITPVKGKTREETSAERNEILWSLRTTLVTFAATALVEPDAFAAAPSLERASTAPVHVPEDSVGTLLRLLQEPLSMTSGVPPAFMQQLQEHCSRNDGGGGPSLVDIFAPIAMRLAAMASSASVLQPDGFAPPLRALAQLTSFKRVAAALAASPQFLPSAPSPEESDQDLASSVGRPLPRCWGDGRARALETESFLGLVLRLQPTAHDFEHGAGAGAAPQTVLDDVCAMAAATGGRDDDDEDGSDEDDGAGARAAQAPQRSLHEQQRVARANAHLEAMWRGVEAAHDGAFAALRPLLASKSARDAVFAWAGAVLDAFTRAGRLTMAFARGTLQPARAAELAGVGNGGAGLLQALTDVLLRMCAPFHEPPAGAELGAANKHALKIDARYMVAPPRFDCDGETRVGMSEAEAAQLLSALRGDGGGGSGGGSGGGGSGGGSGGAGGPSDSWLDGRNHARIVQYERQRAAQVAEAMASAAAAPPAPPAPASASASVSASASASASPSSAEQAAPRTSSGGSASAAAPLSLPDVFGSVTEFHFLAFHCLHVGHLPSLRRRAELARQAQQLQRQVRDTERSAAAATAAADVVAAGAATVTLAALRSQRRRAVASKLCLDALATPAFTQRALACCRLQAAMLLRLACGQGDAPALTPTLPLPLPAPQALSALPEHCVADVAAVVNECPARILVDMDAGSARELLWFFATFISSPVHVRNPYVRADMIKAVMRFVPEMPPAGPGRRAPRPEGALAVVLDDAFLGAHLAPGLLQFFVDIEFTGSHTAFYDKFNSRSVICTIMRELWRGAPAHRAAVVRWSATKHFVRFVNMLLNDTIHHMDGAVEELRELRAAQRDGAGAGRGAGGGAGGGVGAGGEAAAGGGDGGGGGGGDVGADGGDGGSEEEEDVPGTPNLAQMRSRIQWSLRATLDMLEMMDYLTAEPAVRGPFQSDAMVGRVAQMLNIHLDYLVGGRSRELKVEGMEALGFRPVALLSQIVRVFAHFAGSAAFAGAVAADSRAYSPRNLARAERVLRDKGAANGTTLAAFRTFVGRAAAEHTAQQEEETLFEDWPDEFEDPIMGTLMESPMLLPSGNVMERAVLERHLLSSATDPFTREHLALDMATPHSELKAKIQDWKRACRAAGSARAAQGPAVPAPPPPPPPPAAPAGAAASAALPPPLAPAEAPDDTEMAETEEALLQQALAMSLATPRGTAGT